MLGILEKVQRRLISVLVRERERRTLAPLYAPDPRNLDRESHLREALGWLRRAQDAGADRGVSYGTPFGREFDVSYPETTGYICQTFAEVGQATNDQDLLERAREMGEWEAEIQLSGGAVMGGKFNLEPTPAVFNTGMVLLGWAALVRLFGKDQFGDPARRAADWMVSIQEKDGHWIRGHSRFAPPGPTLYNVMAAWGLAEAGRALEEERYIQAAVRNGEYCLARQHSNGWFPDACFSDPRMPLTHTLGYCMQGMLGIGRITGRDDLIGAARLLADSLLEIMGPEGHIPGRLDANLRPAAPWCCLTGSAQTSVVWGELYRLTGEERYREGVVRVNRFLMAHHDIRNADIRLRGGVPGTWPVWGDYGRLSVLSWATKFLVDALWIEGYIAR